MRKIRKIDPEKLKELSHLNANEISRILGTTRGAVARMAKRRGIQLAKRKLVDYSRLPELASQRLTYQQMAEAIGVNGSGGISRAIKRLVPKHTPNWKKFDILLVKRMGRMMSHGIPIRHIAELHGISENTVRSTVLRRLGKGIRSPRRTGKGDYGPPVSDELIGQYAPEIKKRLMASYSRVSECNEEEVDAAVAYAALEMQEWPESAGWQAKFYVIARSRYIDEVRRTLGFKGQKAKVKKAQNLSTSAFELLQEQNDSGDIQEYVRKKIEKLPEVYRELAYAYLQANGVAEDAIRILGIPLGTYWGRLKVVYQYLREICHDFA